jgi:hypothetical protein
MRLAVTSVVCLGPWGTEPGDVEHSQWDPARPSGARPIPGFIESSFNPLVYAAVRRLFDSGAFRGGDKTALLLGSMFGDATTTDLASRLLIQGKPDNALLFYQSVVNSVVGYIARDMGISGTTLCQSGGGLTSMLLEQASLLLASGDANQVILVGAEVAGSEKSDQLWSRYAPGVSPDLLVDAAAAIVIEDEAAARKEQRPVLAVIESEDFYSPAVDDIIIEYDPYSALPLRLGGIQSLVGMTIAVNRLQQRAEYNQIQLTEHGLGGQLNVIRLSRPTASG